MNLLAKEIETLLNSHDYGYPVSVVRSFNADVKTFPRIVVTQINDMTAQRDATKEITSILVFQFDIYTQDMIDADGNAVSRLDVSDDLVTQVDAIIYKQYKMNRDSVATDSAYATDTARRIMRYSCAIDQHGYTYRLV